MASIKNFQLKAVKTFRGHEGEPLRQANLYFNNKKAGFLSEDSYGGYPIIQIEAVYQQAWMDSIQSYHTSHPENNMLGAEQGLFYALFELDEDEKRFKKAVKKGYTVLALFSEKVFYKFKDEEGYYLTNRQEIVTATRLADVTKFENKEFKGKDYIKKVYESLEDFNIA